MKKLFLSITNFNLFRLLCLPMALLPLLTIMPIAMIMGGCHAEERIAPRHNVEAPALRHFPLVTEDEQNQAMLDNKIFLWRTGMTAAQAESIQRSGLMMDQVEDWITAMSSAAPPESDTEGRRRLEEEMVNRSQSYARAIDTVIANTDYFTNRPTLVSLSHGRQGDSVVIQAWEGETYSNRISADSQRRVRDISYQETGGTWKFKVYDGPTAFGSGDYYDFRISRSRIDLTDGRLYYQGDVNLVLNGRIIRRGIAKFGSASFD